MPDIVWWQWLILYALSGGLTTFLVGLAGLWREKADDAISAAEVFCVWPLIVLVLAFGALMLIPEGVKLLATETRKWAGADKKDTPGDPNR
jgi:hypothetical protein